MPGLYVRSGGSVTHPVQCSVQYYYVTCKILKDQEYYREFRFNAVHRLTKHKAHIKNKNTKNGMAIFHKENVRDPHRDPGDRRTDWPIAKPPRGIQAICKGSI